MTLGQKIKEARRQCMLSQEQFAEKMSVSRSAVAKWETDKGLPDIENIKLIAKTLNVSVDYLLDDGEETDVMVVREPYDTAKYENLRKNKVKDAVVKEKFPDCEIYPLIVKSVPTKREKILDNILGFVFDTPFMIPQTVNEINNADNSFYLVEKESEQLFVTVSNEFVETRKLSKRITSDKFTIGQWKYIKCKYTVK